MCAPDRGESACVRVGRVEVNSKKRECSFFCMYLARCARYVGFLRVTRCKCGDGENGKVCALEDVNRSKQVDGQPWIGAGGRNDDR